MSQVPAGDRLARLSQCRWANGAWQHVTPPDPDLRNLLNDLIAGRVCIVGVGNRQRGDDGAGPRVIDLRAPAAQGVWLDAGIVPENFLEPIARTNPQVVLIVDAVAHGAVPGSMCLLDPSAVDTAAVSTHAGSLHLLSEYLTARTAARVKLLAIQPARLDDGEGLSRPVQESVHQLAALLSELLTAPPDTAGSLRPGPRKV